MKKMAYIFLLGVYFITRLPFLVFEPVYYDSFEYVRAISQIDTWHQIPKAILSTHQPVHTGYIGIAAFFRVITHLNPAVLYASISFISGLIGMSFWYLTLKHLYKNTAAAFWGTLVFVLFPYFWRSSTNILYESILTAMQTGTMLMLSIYAIRRKIKGLIAAIVLFAGAQLVFIGNIFSIIPIAVFGLCLKLKKSVLIWAISSILLSLLVDYLISGDPTFITQKYLSHISDTVSPQGGLLLLIARITRNIIVITTAIVYPLPALLSIPALWKLRHDKHIFIMACVFLIFSFMTMQYWHAGNFGRIGFLVVLPISLILGKLFKDYPLIGIATSLILIGNVLKLGSQQRQTPYIHALTTWAKQTSKENKTSLFVTSDYTRFAYEQTQAYVLVVRNPQNDIDKLLSDINKIQVQNGNIFIDSSALSYPYDLPDGWNYHILSMQNKPQLIRESLTKDCNLKLYHEYSSFPALTIYQIEHCTKY